eukprot:78757_1
MSFGLTRRDWLHSDSRDWLHYLRDECIAIKWDMINLYSDFYNKFKKQKQEQYTQKLQSWEKGGRKWDKPVQKNPANSFFATLLQDVENTIITDLIEFVCERWPELNRCIVYVLVLRYIALA